MFSGILTDTHGKGSSSALSTLGKNADVNPSGERLGSINESGSVSMGGLFQLQHVPSLHDVMQSPHVAREPCTQYRTTEGIYRVCRC